MSPGRPRACDDRYVKAISLSKFHFPKGCFTLVLGNEEFGCSKQLVEAADTIVLLRLCRASCAHRPSCVPRRTVTRGCAQVEIPLYGRKNSLNVANAFAVVAAEIRKQQAPSIPC